jgi:hypothetical protein
MEENEDNNQRKRSLLTDWRVLLLLIFIFGLAIRAYPGMANAAWGNDFGTYYGLTEKVMDDPALFPEYDGWGSGYNYFPVLFHVSAGAAWLTDTDAFWLMPRLIPLIGSLTIFVTFFIGKELFKSEKIGLLAALMLAANPMHAYQISHAAPLVMGHLFFSLSIYLFLVNDGKLHRIGLLAVCSLLMIMSHHLTTFFFLLSVLGIIFYKNMWSNEWRPGFQRELVLALAISASAFAYWALVAKPVFDAFIPDIAGIPAWGVFAAFYLGLAAMLGLIIARRRYMPTMKCAAFGMKRSHVLAGTLAGSIAFTLVFSFINLPDSNFSFQPVSALILIPFFLLLALGFTAIRELKGSDEGGEVLGWFIFLAASTVITMVLWIEGIPSFRHFEYIAYPLSLMAAVGVHGLYLDVKGGKLKFPMGARGMAAAIIALALVLGGSTYLVADTTSGHTEVIGEEALDLMEWMQQNIPEGTNISSDHRLSTMLWAYGFGNLTYDDAYEMWFADNWTEDECLADLNGTSDNLLRIEYVLIDSVMVEDGVQSGMIENPRTMEGGGYEKFESRPFEMVHEVRGGAHWAELYFVNWTYVSANTP